MRHTDTEMLRLCMIEMLILLWYSSNVPRLSKKWQVVEATNNPR